MTLRVPDEFNFWRTVYSHGWCALPPFLVDKGRRTLSSILCVESPGRSTQIIRLEIRQRHRGSLVLEFPANRSLTPEDRRNAGEAVRSILRLNEDFSEFYAIARKHPSFRWVPKMGAGRLLRAPTVFEDVVKMICTTNCSWALTETIVDNLCTKLGSRIVPISAEDGARYSFPTPEAIAECSEKFLRKEIRAGYRAPYLRELGRRVVKGNLNVEAWRQSTLPTGELYDEVSSVKGIGPYAAGNILKLLGRYDYLALDSWCRKKFFEIHKNGRTTSDKVIEKFYEPFGKWRGLFFWMDVTKHWYDKATPF